MLTLSLSSCVFPRGWRSPHCPPRRPLVHAMSPPRRRAIAGLHADPVDVSSGSVRPLSARHVDDTTQSDVARAFSRLGTALWRAGVVGMVLKGGLNAFALVARSRRKRVAGAGDHFLRDAARDTAAFTAFLVAFTGVYVGVDEALAARCGKQRSKGWRAAVAGGLAGPTLLLADGPHGRGTKGGGTRHYGLATYIWLRSLVLLVRCALKKAGEGEASGGAMPVGPRLRRMLLAPFASPYADTGLMMASASVILSCFINKPEALRGAYGSFLDKHGGKSVKHYRAVQRVCLAKTNRETSEVAAWAARTLYPRDAEARDALFAASSAAVPASIDDPAARALRARLYGMILYPGRSAVSHCLEFFAKSLPRSLAVNLPMYLVPALLVHRKKLFGPRGPDLALRVAVGCVRSSAFLSAYCALAWLGPAAVQHVCGDMRWWTITCGVPLAGLATLLEKPSRRQELGVYCASRAVESAVLCALSWGWVPRQARGWRLDVALFCLAAAAIMHCYNAERDVFRSKYLNVLDFVFGNIGHGRQSIRHVGSFAVLANPPQMASPYPGVFKGRRNSEEDGKRTTLSTLISSPGRKGKPIY